MHTFWLIPRDMVKRRLEMAASVTVLFYVLQCIYLISKTTTILSLYIYIYMYTYKIYIYIYIYIHIYTDT